ncbi:MAG: alanine:cation symporter family protein [Bacteroides sp.]|nr:alanine:cation symporter family protein [Bacteroides sp.]
MQIIDVINEVLWSYVMIAMLLLWAIYFTVATGGVQFRMIGEMCRLLVRSAQPDDPDGRRQTDDDTADAGNRKHKRGDKPKKEVSSFQAFAMSIASRVGTGNLAGVATAIALGGPGAVMWMWIIALLGSANAFIESTLAQLFKVKGKDSFQGGPAYYIQMGIGKRWWAVLFAILITVTFGLAFNSVQSNTIAESLKAFNVDSTVTGVVLMVMTLMVICGGITRISRFSEVVVPIMAVAYILLALVVLILNIGEFPRVISEIVENAFNFRAGLGGGVGAAIMMGIKRGLFSNEAGEGSAPNVAATATVSHPVKQGLIQTLSVFTDTLVICTCTAFIILLNGAPDSGLSGIALTQNALDMELGMNLGSIFVATAIFFFAFTSIVANYYYGETNIQFITPRRWVVWLYRIIVAGMVLVGAVSTLDFVWALADITMACMTICNLVAIAVLGRYAIILLNDYRSQLRNGRDPVYHSSKLPKLNTPSWD